MPPRRPSAIRPPLPARLPLPRLVRSLPIVARVAPVVGHRAPTLPPTVPVAPAVPRSPAAYRGPDPYVDFQRDFTDAGGICLTFKIKDPQAWRTVIRVLLWLAAIAVTLWFAMRASPFPLIPPRCAVRACPGTVWLAHVGVNAVLIGLAAGVYAWILFHEDETYASLEVRPDCLIVDCSDVFWRAHMDLGWPQLAPGPDGSTVLRGVYGTREIDYLTLHAFDEKDRAIQVIGAQLQFAMQQLWAQPGARR